MKKILILLTLCMTLLGASSFSPQKKEIFLKELQNSSSFHKTKTYMLKRGWNTLTTPKDGVLVPQTFNTSKVELVVAYDKTSKLWATFSNYSNLIAPNMKDEKILFLKYLEPNTKFFVLAKSPTTIEIKSIEVSETCKNIMNDSRYDYIISSVLDLQPIVSKDNSITLKSGYFTHHEKGFYNETRVMLIYPKLKTKNKAIYKYGPAFPKVAIKYAKEYEEKEFYIFDYKNNQCHKGLFPSKRVPPYPRLKSI